MTPTVTEREETMKTVVVVVVVGCGPAWPTLLIEVIDITRPSKPRPITFIWIRF
jgi:hypothetical protein